MRESDDKTDEDKENADSSRMGTPISQSTDISYVGLGRESNKTADVDSDGLLDLSNSGLTNLDRNFQEEYTNVRHLDVSGNEIENFVYMKMFANCETINANDNQMRKFAAAFNNNMKELHLSNNLLQSASQFSRFENLVYLDLSQNDLQEHFALSLQKLKVLFLNKNNLKRLPDLSKCTNLTQLDLSDNKITDLQKMPELICTKKLTHLSISSNLITDISQFSQLSKFKLLTELSVAENPCVCSEERFAYRPYFLALCSELMLLNGQEIGDLEQLEGEYISINVELRSVAPGNHEKVRDIMSRTFPSNDDAPPTPAQKACQKALEKKRESGVMESDRTVNSVYSPCREWSGKMEGRTPIRRISTPVRRDRNLRMCSPPGKNRSFTFRNGNLPETPEPPFPNAPNFSRTNSTETVILSSRTEFSVGSTPLPNIESLPPQVLEESKSANPRSPSVADISVMLDQNEELTKKVAQLEGKVDQLAVQNLNLTKHNEELTTIMEHLAKEQTEMWKAIRASVPIPQKMTTSFHSENERGFQTHTMRWELPIVEGYEIFVDGNKCGRIEGKNNSARITDLDPDKPHDVEVQTIGLGGIRGRMSEKLRVNPQ